MASTRFTNQAVIIIGALSGIGHARVPSLADRVISAFFLRSVQRRSQPPRSAA